MGKNVHVVKHDDGWATRREGSDRISRSFDTQAQAIDAGATTAKNDNVELLIHGRDNKIRARNSYGNDPHPPRG